MAGLIAHEWIAQHGGAENVLDQMRMAFPDAATRVLWNDAPDRFHPDRVSESWMAHTAFRRHKALALPMMPPTWRAVDVKGYDFVLTSSHLFAHHVGGRTAARPPSFHYVHTPARMLWAPEQDPRGANIGAKVLGPYLRKVDRRRVDKSASFVANSEYIRDRVQGAWGVEAGVIYPPVRSMNRHTELDEVEAEALSKLPKTFILGASRFVEYKRLDLVLDVAQRMGLPAVLAGNGPLRASFERQRERLGTGLHLMISPSDGLLRELFAAASVFVFPAVEDFGIMPVEAMAVGTPVVVSPAGGASESVRIAHGGVVSEAASAGAFAEAVEEALRLDMSHVPAVVQQAFSEQRFRRQVTDWIKSR